MSAAVDGTGAESAESHCEMIIADVLESVNVWAGTNGTDKGKLYRTVTETWFPGLLQGGDPGQVDPEV